MHKVLWFWGIIFIILIGGAVAVVYGKMLLKEEQEKQDMIVQEILAGRKLQTLPDQKPPTVQSELPKKPEMPQAPEPARIP